MEIPKAYGEITPSLIMPEFHLKPGETMTRDAIILFPYVPEGGITITDMSLVRGVPTPYTFEIDAALPLRVESRSSDDLTSMQWINVPITITAPSDYLGSGEEHIMFQVTQLNPDGTENGSGQLMLVFIDAGASWLLIWASVAGAVIAAGATIFHFRRKKAPKENSKVIS